MERTMTAYTTRNTANNENSLKEKMVTMINAVRAKAASILSRLRKEEVRSYTGENYDLERQIEYARASMNRYTQLQTLR